MGEVSEPEGAPAEVFQSAVDRLCWSVAGARSVEVGQHIAGPFRQCPAEAAQLDQRGRDGGPDDFDHRGQLGLAAAAVEVR